MPSQRYPDCGDYYLGGGIYLGLPSNLDEPYFTERLRAADLRNGGFLARIEWLSEDLVSCLEATHGSPTATI